MNVVAIMGRLTYEPELRVTPSNVSVLRFQIAVDRNYSPKGQDRQVDFIDCVAWRQTAEFISRYFHKGSMIAVEGSIQTSSYTDKNGNNRKQIEVVANNVSFCGNKSANNSSGQAPPVQSYAQGYSSADTSDFEEIVDDEDDLPF